MHQITIVALQELNGGAMGKLVTSEQTCCREQLLTTVQYSSPLVAFLLFEPFSSYFLSPFSIQYVVTSLYDPK